MTKEKLIKTRKIANNILSYSLIGFLFLVVGVSLLYKSIGKPFYFFNRRYDVVLTDSMSSKNEEHLDFLEGHDDQIQAFDFVISEKVNDSTKLNVYDIVIYDNPRIGTDMHRVIAVEDVGDTFELNNLKKDQFNGKEAFSFYSPASSIFLNTDFMFSKIEAVTYSSEPYDVSEYYFNINSQEVSIEVYSIQLLDGSYMNTISYERNSTAPAYFSVTKKSYEFDSHFAYIKLYGVNEECKITPEIISGEEKQEVMFNITQRYMIRGDKAKTDDGWYKISDIDSKVIRVIPKFGYVTRFLSSPYGTILILGIAMLPIVYWMIFDRKGKEANEKQK